MGSENLVSNSRQDCLHSLRANVIKLYFSHSSEQIVKETGLSNFGRMTSLVVGKLWIQSQARRGSAWQNKAYHSPCHKWCNGYRRRKSTRRHEFKSWTRLIAFHIALLPLGKVWIQLFSLQLWINSRADWVFQPWWGN